ncbi:hypothetical protein F2P81_005146 [Scophthalmus maximus]|uniref:Uncharacterized protein n=1 Tax=Scophthalmus maximus TaxID=52904 RepID=A0A6A4TEH7_SCOMX|nr:hypothetical protein F2P81_005146 [Scophthalmus maximus]
MSTQRHIRAVTPPTQKALQQRGSSPSQTTTRLRSVFPVTMKVILNIVSFCSGHSCFYLDSRSLGSKHLALSSSESLPAIAAAAAAAGSFYSLTPTSSNIVHFCSDTGPQDVQVVVTPDKR